MTSGFSEQNAIPSAHCPEANAATERMLRAHAFIKNIISCTVGLHAAIIFSWNVDRKANISGNALR